MDLHFGKGAHERSCPVRSAGPRDLADFLTIAVVAVGPSNTRQWITQGNFLNVHHSTFDPGKSQGQTRDQSVDEHRSG